MDLSEFKPPVRLSMSDEEIYQALGAAQANEDGIARAMAIVEEQANLREHDNQLFAEWVVRMQTSDAPEAKIALENVERAKQGLEPLSLTSNLTPVYSEPAAPGVVDNVVAALNAAHAEPEVISDQSLETLVDEGEDEEEGPVSIFASLHEAPVETLAEQNQIAEPVLESVVEVPIEFVPETVSEAGEVDFDQLLAEAATEATTSIMVSGESFEPAVTFETDEPTNFEVSADEDALVQEEHKKSPLAPAESGWWQNSAFWVISIGILPPVLVAFMLSSVRQTFGTAVVGFGLALLVNLGFIISAHFTAQRSAEPQVVTTRATFGVFGAALPTVGILTLALALIMLLATGTTSAFGIALDLGAELVPGFTLGQLISIATVVLAILLAGFAKKILSWVNAVAAGLLLVTFIVAALITRDQIDFARINMSVDIVQALLEAAVIGIFISIFTYGKAPQVIGSKVGQSKTIARWSALVGFAVVLPLAVFAHFSLIMSQSGLTTSFNLISALGLAQQNDFVTPILWVIGCAAFVFALNLGDQVLTSLRGFALNNVRGWIFAVSALVAGCLYWLAPSLETWLSILTITLVPVATSVGFAVADSLVRRGEYHEASLLRGYGFYGKINVLALIGYALIVAAGWGLTAPSSVAPWLGYFGATPPEVPALALVGGVVWGLITGIPRILVQEREVAEVELRKASLSEFPGFSE